MRVIMAADKNEQKNESKNLDGDNERVSKERTSPESTETRREQWPSDKIGRNRITLASLFGSGQAARMAEARMRKKTRQFVSLWVSFRF